MQITLAEFEKKKEEQKLKELTFEYGLEVFEQMERMHDCSISNGENGAIESNNNTFCSSSMPKKGASKHNCYENAQNNTTKKAGDGNA